MVQRGISAIPKSSNPDRIRQNIDIFDIELTPDDFQLLEGISERQRIYPLTSYVRRVLVNCNGQ